MTPSRRPPYPPLMLVAGGAVDSRAHVAARLIGDSLLALVARIGIAGIFIMSGPTKVEGLLSVTDGAVGLFRDEYRLPLLSPELAANLVAYAEHFFLLLLVLGRAPEGRHWRCSG